MTHLTREEAEAKVELFVKALYEEGWFLGGFSLDPRSDLEAFQ
jgi:hypothetical protein